MAATGGQAVIADATFFDRDLRATIAAAAKAARRALRRHLAACAACPCWKPGSRPAGTTRPMRRSPCCAAPPRATLAPMDWIPVDASGLDLAATAIRQAIAARQGP
ncbi:MAG: hypothetical protein WDN49_04585 [Acetobacteraceae bacterium]